MAVFMRGNIVIAALAATASLLVQQRAFAHHSFAMFERDKTMMIQGEVKEFQFMNPHTWIQVLVPDGKGGSKEWGIECGSPNMMQRHGWKSRTLKPGDKVGLVMRPMRDGSAAGSLVSITLADGRVLGPGGAPAPATGNAPVPK